MTDPWLPPISVSRGGIRYQPFDHADDPARLAYPDLCNHRWGDRGLHLCDETIGHPMAIPHRCRCSAILFDRSPEPALVAMGGLCAPVASFYDIVDRTPWTHSDLPWCWDIDVDRWLFPRLFCWQLRFAELRRRLRLVRLAIAGGDLTEINPEDVW